MLFTFKKKLTSWRLKVTGTDMVTEMVTDPDTVIATALHHTELHCIIL